jgi:hypothetical protein
MTHRSQYEGRSPRQAGRPQDDHARPLGRDARFDRPYDDAASRDFAARDDMSAWDAGYRGERQYPAYEANDRGQYLGSYPTEQGPRYYGEPAASRDTYGRMQPSGNRYYGGAYGPEDFRQGSGERPYEASRSAYPPRRYLGSRYEAQESYGASQRSSAPGAYTREFEEDHYDYGQSFGGYSPSQHGYGQGYSGYGRGGYGLGVGDTLRQDFDQPLYGTGNSSLGSNYGAGVGNERLGYGSPSPRDARYGRSFESDYGMPRRESQFGKGPKGYARSDERLKEDISERLMRDHDVDASDIDIEVRNGKVTLSGSIADRRLKHYVEDTVEQCLGVQDIDNRLVVRGASRAGSDGASTFAGQAASTGTTGSRASTTTPGSGSLGGSTGDEGKESRRN